MPAGARRRRAQALRRRAPSKMEMTMASAATVLKSCKQASKNEQVVWDTAAQQLTGGYNTNRRDFLTNQLNEHMR